MAGDWIKWTVGLTRKREVIAIAAAMNLSRREVAAMLMEIWEWADANTSTGHVPSVTYVTLDEFVNCDGFAHSMSKEGWLVCGEDSVTFPNFTRHNGKSAKERALAADRKRKQREAVTEESRKKRDTSTLLYSNLLSSSLDPNGGSGGAESLKPETEVVTGQVLRLSYSDYQGLLVNHYNNDETKLREHISSADDNLVYKAADLLDSCRSAAYIRNWKKKAAEFAQRNGKSRDAERKAKEDERDREFFKAFGKNMEDFLDEQKPV